MDVTSFFNTKWRIVMKIRNIAVIGAGLMGSGITQAVANSGFKVVLQSRRGKQGLERLNRAIKKSRIKGILNEEQASLLMSRISWVGSVREAVEGADLVIEAVAEDLAVKKAIFSEMDYYSASHTILASNTSSLSIACLAEATSRIDKVVGMHFFNPAPIMRLVEIIQTPMTSKGTVQSASKFAEELGKVPLIIEDSSGSIVNTILMPMINVASYALMKKVAAAETIDSAMKLGANHPIGPLALADLIGIDLCVKVMKELNSKPDTIKYEVCPLLEEMVAKGYLGRKSGKGFFTYDVGFMSQIAPGLIYLKNHSQRD
jgi:3-hydroxybutyryl-CoA dehydrogenase